jgi:predicted ATPase
MISRSVHITGGYIDLAARRGERDGEGFSLTSREAGLLSYLVARSGEVVSIEELLTEVWGYSPSVVSRAAHDTARRTRLKIERDPSAPVHLLTEHGVGFRWVALDGAVPTISTGAASVSSDFVGRDEAVRDVGAALDASRIVSVVGPGGVGKTRLIRELTRRRAPLVGVVWLEECRDRQGILRAVADVLKVPRGDDLGATVATALRGRRGLLVLDNAEQVVDTIRQLLGQWSDAPDLRFLITSRCPVELPAEQVVYLDALDPGGAAVELLRRRALAADPSLGERLNDADLALVAAAVDGLPLALELAAPKLLVLTPSALAEQLLASPAALRERRGGAGRHASLEACIRWSWNLLTVQERDALVRCAAFHSAFDAADLAAVAGLDSLLDAVDLLLHAGRQSLLVPARDSPEPRWRMPYAVGSFLRTQSDWTAVQEDCRQRHAEWFSRLGADEHLSHESPQWHDRRTHLPAVLEDLSAAFEWETRQEFGVPLAKATLLGLLVRGDVPQAASVLAEARRRWPAPQVLAELIHACQTLDSRTIAPIPSAALLEALDRASQSDRNDLAAAVSAWIAADAYANGRFDVCAKRLEDAEGLAAAAGDSGYAAVCLAARAECLISMGELDRAEKIYPALLPRLAEHRRLASLSGAWLGYGGLAWRKGDLDTAEHRARRSLAIAVECGEPVQIAAARTSLGVLHFGRGEFDAALENFQALADDGQRLGNTRLLAGGLMRVGDVHCVRAAFSAAEDAMARCMAVAQRADLAFELNYAPFRLALLHLQHGDLGAARGYLDRVTPVKLRANFAWRASLMQRALDVATGTADTLDEHIREIAAKGPTQEFIALVLVATALQRGGHDHLFRSVLARARRARQRLDDAPCEEDLALQRLIALANQ